MTLKGICSSFLAPLSSPLFTGHHKVSSLVHMLSKMFYLALGLKTMEATKYGLKLLKL
jgi:hypothetical protein